MAVVQIDAPELPADDPPRSEGKPRRLGAALRAAGGGAGPSPPSGIPGLRRELFPAAAWRRRLDEMDAAEHEVEEERRRREKARVDYALAELRAEEILQRARTQARRLVGTAAAVARARRQQAEREAAEALAHAERVAAETIAHAQDEAREIAAAGPSIIELNERLTRLRTSLRDAETKLGAFSASTRRELEGGSGVIDLSAEEGDGRATPVAAVPGATAEEAAGAVVAVPRTRGRFNVTDTTPDRIETLRDELAP